MHFSVTAEASGLFLSAMILSGARLSHASQPAVFNYSDYPANTLRRRNWGAPSGGRTDDIPRPHIGNVPYGTIIDTCTVPGTVALTFDDGPSDYTSMVLKLLSHYSAKATFFVNGNNNGLGLIDNPSTPWPSLLWRIYSEGHQIGSHTWSHADLSYASPYVRDEQMVYNEMALRNVFGFFPTYLRPPYGSCSAESGCQADLGDRGYHVINFDVDTKDYCHDSPWAIQWSKDVFAAMLGSSGYNYHSSGAGHIVLAHDSHYETAASLTEFMLATLADLGYRAVTVGDCLGDPRENWYRSTSPGALHDSEPASVSEPSGLPHTSEHPEAPLLTSESASLQHASELAPPPSEPPSEPIHANEPEAASHTAPAVDLVHADAATHTPPATDPAHADDTTYTNVSTDDTHDQDHLALPPQGLVSASPAVPQQEDPELEYPTEIELPSTANGHCGSQVGLSCRGSTFGQCCSKFGHCGVSSQHCGYGCQHGFGTCW